MARHIALGSWGEDLAARTYARRGYELLDRNWRSRTGELDLVLANGRQLVIAEVKTRRSAAFGYPIEAVTPAKIARIHRLAAEWRRAQPRRWGQTRFDVVSVLDGRVEIHEGVF